MSTSWPCNMRGPQLKTLLFVLLLLLTALTRTGFCQDYEDAPESDPPADEEEAFNPDSDGSEVGADTEAADQIPTEPGAATTVIPPALEDLVESTIAEEEGSGHDRSLQTGDPTEDPSLSGTTGPQEEEVDSGLNPIIILIPVALVVIIIPMIVCGIFINRRWNNKARDQEMKKEDPYLDESSTEKVPMPMFEEDVPSVLELEMEELDQWMKKDDDTAEDSKQA